MDCRSFRDSHLAFLDETLGELELVEAQRHLAECAECSALDVSVRRSLMIARSQPLVRPSRDFGARLQQKLRAAQEADLREHKRPGQHGPGLGTFAAAATGVIAAGLLAVTVMERFRRSEPIELAPVVAMLPEPVPEATPAFVASVLPIAPMWPAAMLVDQAPIHFATAELRSDR